MRILVTGASGLLGSHLVAWFSRRHEVVGIDRHPAWWEGPVRLIQEELTQPGFVSETVPRIAPHLLIHCAAVANVDACERDPVLAYEVNANLTRTLARAVSPQCLFVFISTDGLFKGETPFAAEQQVPSPLTVYGRSKWMAEQEVQQATANHLIVRTNFYGWSSGRKKTAAEWLYASLEKGEEITLFDDFFFTPIYVVDFVKRLDRLIEGATRGLVHLGGRDRVSKSQFGIQMAREASFSTARGRHGSIERALGMVRRPKDMSLDSSLFCRLTGLSVPSSLEGLRRFLQDRGRGLTARFDEGLAVSAAASDVRTPLG